MTIEWCYPLGGGGAGGRKTSRSKASAARRMVASSPCRPTSIMPTGSPADIAQGTFMAGWPVTSNGAVLGIISRARATVSSSGASAAGRGVALSGRVGMTSRSWAPSASS